MDHLGLLWSQCLYKGFEGFLRLNLNVQMGLIKLTSSLSGLVDDVWGSMHIMTYGTLLWLNWAMVAGLSRVSFTYNIYDYAHRAHQAHQNNYRVSILHFSLFTLLVLHYGSSLPVLFHLWSWEDEERWILVFINASRTYILNATCNLSSLQWLTGAHWGSLSWLADDFWGSVLIMANGSLSRILVYRPCRGQFYIKT